MFTCNGRVLESEIKQFFVNIIALKCPSKRHLMTECVISFLLAHLCPTVQHQPRKLEMAIYERSVHLVSFELLAR